MWAKPTSGRSLAIDKKGNICMSLYNSTKLMKFNPNGDSFLVKNTSPYFPTVIAIDDSDNIYGTSVNYLKFPDIQKYDSGGNFLWEREARAVKGFHGGGQSMSVVADNAGNAYITGYFTDTISIGYDTLRSPFPYKFLQPTGYSMFLAKFDNKGKFVWAKQSLGKQKWRGCSLAKDKYDNIYLGGSGVDDDSLAFAGQVLKIVSASTSNDASFILKLDTAGNFISGELLKNGTFNYQPADFDNEVAVDSTGRFAYLTGSFQSDTIYVATDTLFDGAGQACYIARWGCSHNEEGITPISAPNASIILFPNPNNGVFNIGIRGMGQGVSKIQVEIYNVLGERVYSKLLIPNPQLLINLTGQPSGIYFYRVMDETGNPLGSGKVIIEK